MHAHPNRQVLGRGVELVEIVVPLIEVVAHLLMRHGDRTAAAAVGVPVLGGRGQLRGGNPVAPMQIDHGARQGGMSGDYVGDLGRIDVDVQVLVLHHLAQLGDEAAVVLGGEERRVDAEHFGDTQEHRDGQGADVMLDLVEVARGDLQHLGKRSLAEPAFAAELTKAPSNVRLGHADQRTRLANSIFAVLARCKSAQDALGIMTPEPDAGEQSSWFAFWAHPGGGDRRTWQAELSLAMTGATVAVGSALRSQRGASAAD